MLQQEVPPQIAAIVAAKNERRRELAALSWEDKVDIIQRMWSLREALPAEPTVTWNDVCQQFIRLLRERIVATATLTEDSLRHTFFLALVQTGFCTHVQISLGERHPAFEGENKEIDLVARPQLACEFKFDRGIPSGKNQPRPQKMGALFADVFRLARISVSFAKNKYLIYFTDGEMAAYLSKTRNEPLGLLQLKPNETIEISQDYGAKLSRAFQKRAGNPGKPCRMMCVCHADFERDYHLRIWQIYD